MQLKQRKEKLERLIIEIEERRFRFISILVELILSPKFYYSLIIPFLLTILLAIATLKYAIIIISIALGFSLHPLLKTIAETFDIKNKEHGN
jgi:hypothetical protein